jgi:quinohemoprotein ethanol dehydrogenase
MGTSGGYLGPLIEEFGLQPKKQARRVLTFALDGATELPAAEMELDPFVSSQGFVTDAAKASEGHLVYAQYCAVCHGQGAVAVGAASDLRRSRAITASEAFTQIVRGGALVEAGMPAFADLSASSVDAVRHYLLGLAAKAAADMRENQPSEKKGS